MLHRSSLLSYDQLATIEFLTIGAHAVERSNIKIGDTILVIGAGPIGLSVIQFAKLKGIRVIVMDLNKNRLNFAKSRLKVDEIIYPENGFSADNLRVSELHLPDAILDVRIKPMGKLFKFCVLRKLIFVGLFIGKFSFMIPFFIKKKLHYWQQEILYLKNSKESSN